VDLEALGWNAAFAEAFAPYAAQGYEAARISLEHKGLYRVLTERDELLAEVRGKLRYTAQGREDFPAVGDWVAIETPPGGGDARIGAILPRTSRFSRRAAGNPTEEQVVAANVDVVFIVMALDADFSLRRLERYLLLARESGASAVVLLTKPDLCGDAPARAAAVAAVAGEAPVHILSPKFNHGVEQVGEYLRRGRTGALLGSSGVGKSTIINRLIGADVRKTREVRESDSRGRHTTTHRELIVLPDGGLIIDTPGMRELQLWDVSAAVRETFDDVESLAPGCYFTNCRHRDEPRCAVKTAVAAGELSSERLQSYLKLQDELAELTRQQDQRAQIEEKRRSKRPR